MIALAFSVVAGFVFGYLLVGPANLVRTPRAWALLVGFLAFMLGVVLFTALSLASLFNPDSNPTIPGYLASLGFWAAYSGAVAAGAFVQQRRRK